MAATFEEFQTVMMGFIGSEQLFRSPVYGEPNYTEGVRYFFQNGGRNGQTAYWLMDLIATTPAIRKQAEDFAFITLKVVDRSAVLTVTDGNSDKPVYRQVIEFTDAWEGEWRFYWRNGVLMLPREY